MTKSLLNKLSILGLIAATLAWGASFILIKEAVGFLGVWPFLFLRYSIAFILIFLIFPRRFLKPERGLPRATFWLGFFLFLASFTQTQGLVYTSVGHSGFITSLYVPFTPLLGWMIFKNRITARDLFIVVLATLGLYILTSRRESVGGFGTGVSISHIGDWFTLVTAVVYAIQILIVERVVRRFSDSISVGIWQFFWCFIFVDLGFIGEWFVGNINFKVHSLSLANLVSIPVIVVASVFFNAVVTTDFAFMIQIICQKTISSTKAAVIFALEAPFACFFTFLFRGEMLTKRELCGALLVLIACLWPANLINFRKRDLNGAF
jgi:drug/metabolite transporter (DMT)-like permease